MLALVAGVAALGLTSSTQPASAENSSAVEITLTKWRAGDAGELQGIIGGDIGAGSMTGQIVTADPTVAKGAVTAMEAVYHVKGSNNSFDAHIDVRMFNKSLTGYFDGFVTDGWMVGSRIEGEFKGVKCDQSKGGCFQVVMHLFPTVAQ